MDNQPAKKIENTSKIDRISNLPSGIIDNILICLPIHEAVATCTLSKKWRSNWRYLSKLVFDNSFYQKSILPSAAQPNITKLFLNIYKVILLHRGPILNFTFHVPLSKAYPEINQLFLYLSEKDVGEVFFDMGGNKFSSFPSYLFSCVTLRRLTLSLCSIKVPLGFQGFVKLISLTFESVDFKTNVFETFISKCPLLETLSINDCTDIGELDIEFDIDIPYLKFFQISGNFKAIRFRNTCERLSTVIFDGDFTGLEYSEPTKLFECLPIIEHLSLGYAFLQYLVEGIMPRKLSATLGCLKVLELPDICFGHEDYVSAVLCLIMSSPNLQKFEIGSVAADFYFDLADELLKVEDLLDNALKKLQVVKMTISDTEEVKPELEFIKLLLAESVALEKMFIKPAYGTTTEEGFKILKEITRFQRASKKAEILYLDP